MVTEQSKSGRYKNECWYIAHSRLFIQIGSQPRGFPPSVNQIQKCPHKNAQRFVLYESISCQYCQVDNINHHNPTCQFNTTKQHFKSIIITCVLIIHSLSHNAKYFQISKVPISYRILTLLKIINIHGAFSETQSLS